MTKEQIEVSNRNSKGTFDIILHYDQLELVMNNSPLLVGWDPNTGSQYGHWRIKLIKPLETSLRDEFMKIEELLSSKKLSESGDEINNLLSNFVNGEYKIRKYEHPSYSIEVEAPKKIFRKENEIDIKEQFSLDFTKARHKTKKNIPVRPIISWTMEEFPDFGGTIICLTPKGEQKADKVDKYIHDIQNSRYPYCLIASNFSETSGESEPAYYYCIGTSEILTAYRKLGLLPRFVDVQKISDGSVRLQDSLISQLSDSLFSWELLDMFNNCFNYPAVIERIRKLNRHPFKQFIK